VVTRALNPERVSNEEKLHFIRQFPEFTLVSVGSGNGRFEYQVQRALPGRRVICVDPDPEAFDPYPQNGQYIAPEYSFVANLVEHEPDIVGNCCLILHWPQHNGVPYDIEAVRDLRPQAIFVYYEAIGAAGSIAFHYWLRNCVSGPALPTQYDYGKRMAEMKQLYANLGDAILPEGYRTVAKLLKENKQAAKLRTVSDIPMLATPLTFSAKAYCSALIAKRS
jgi:hypothetical protein